MLVVEDDRDTRANLRDILELDGHTVETTGSVAETLKRNNWGDIGTIILDYKLPDGSAETLLPKLRELAPKAAVIVSTGVAGLNGAILALQYGAADYILKPLNADALRASLARIAERQQLARAKERTDAAFRTLVEAAPTMIAILGLNRCLLYLSPFMEKMTGYASAEAKGQDFIKMFVPDEARAESLATDLNHIAENPLRGVETPIQCKDGSRRWVVWNAQLADYEDEPAILAIGQDITSLKHAQEQALQSERLAAIG
ncbi:MAG TPA: PAS domain S-box protein, partial [Gemmataceae bacterium]|nr:PAS domain S-box protein [Gemmataceae bacterium]